MGGEGNVWGTDVRVGIEGIDDEPSAAMAQRWNFVSFQGHGTQRSWHMGFGSAPTHLTSSKSDETEEMLTCSATPSRAAEPRSFAAQQDAEEQLQEAPSAAMHAALVARGGAQVASPQRFARVWNRKSAHCLPLSSGFCRNRNFEVILWYADITLCVVT